MSAMESALDLDDHIPAGAAPGHSNGSHCGLGSAAHKAQPLHAGVEGGHPFRKPDLQLAWRAIKPAPVHLIRNRFFYGRMAVAQDHGAVGQAVIDEPVAVAVP